MEYNYKTLELKIISASDLQKPTLFSPRTHLYVVVSLSSLSTSHSTPVSPDGGRNPTWNYPITFPLPSSSSSAALNTLLLHFQVRRRSTLAATPSKLIGEVRIPFLDLLSDKPTPPPGIFISYQIRTPSGRSKGVLTISYRFTEPLNKLNLLPPPPYPPVDESPAKVYPTDLPGKVSLYPSPGDVYPPSAAMNCPSSYPFNCAYLPPPQEGNVRFGGQVVSGYPASTGYGYPVESAHQYGYGYRG